MSAANNILFNLLSPLICLNDFSITIILLNSLSHHSIMISVCLCNDCLFACLIDYFNYLFVYLFVCLVGVQGFTWCVYNLFVCLFSWLYICMFVCWGVYLFICLLLFVWLFVKGFTCLAVCLFAYLHWPGSALTVGPPVRHSELYYKYSEIKKTHTML